MGRREGGWGWGRPCFLLFCLLVSFCFCLFVGGRGVRFFLFFFFFLFSICSLDGGGGGRFLFYISLLFLASSCTILHTVTA